jgi:hypothetical protein
MVSFCAGQSVVVSQRGQWRPDAQKRAMAAVVAVEGRASVVREVDSRMAGSTARYGFGCDPTAQRVETLSARDGRGEMRPKTKTEDNGITRQWDGEHYRDQRPQCAGRTEFLLSEPATVCIFLTWEICLSTAMRGEGPSRYHLHDASYAGDRAGMASFSDGAWC